MWSFARLEVFSDCVIFIYWTQETWNFVLFVHGCVHGVKIICAWSCACMKILHVKITHAWSCACMKTLFMRDCAREARIIMRDRARMRDPARRKKTI